MKNFTKILLACLIVAAPAAQAWSFSGLMRCIKGKENCCWVHSSVNVAKRFVKKYPYIFYAAGAALIAGIAYKTYGKYGHVMKYDSSSACPSRPASTPDHAAAQKNTVTEPVRVTLDVMPDLVDATPTALPDGYYYNPGM